jgi:hypothetical protein
MASADQINDAMKWALHKEFYEGALNDMLMQWLKAEGAAGEDIMKLWSSFFTIKGIPGTQHTERMKAWYSLEGFTQITLSDSALAYWKNRALTP